MPHTLRSTKVRPLSLLLGAAMLGLFSLQQYKEDQLLSASVRVGVQVVAPEAQIVNVTSPNANGTYVAGQTVQVYVQFDQNIYIHSGIPTIALNTGGTGSYLSGSGTDTLVFTYLIQTAELTSDLDQLSTSALLLHGATIRNVDTVDASLTLPAPGISGSLGANKNIVIALVSDTSSASSSQGNTVSGATNDDVQSGGRRSIPTIIPEGHPAAPPLSDECPPTIVQDTYKDVPASAWFASGVRTLLCKEYLDTTFDTFRAGEGATRAEVAKLLALVHHFTVSNTAVADFSDTNDVQWATPFIQTVAEQKVMLGTNNCFGSHPCLFRPGDAITRAEFAATLLRSFHVELDGASQEFSDVPREAWYFETITTAAEQCILQGDALTGTMRPNEAINRAEMVTMIDRIIQGTLSCSRNPHPHTIFISTTDTPVAHPLSPLPTVNASYSYTQKSPIARASEALSCTQCQHCGNGWAGFCSMEECLGLGACTFTHTLLWTSCMPSASACHQN